jgi:hypothetical protein
MKRGSFSITAAGQSRIFAGFPIKSRYEPGTPAQHVLYTSL